MLLLEWLTWENGTAISKKNATAADPMQIAWRQFETEACDGRSEGELGSNLAHDKSDRMHHPFASAGSAVTSQNTEGPLPDLILQIIC